MRIGVGTKSEFRTSKHRIIHLLAFRICCCCRMTETKVHGEKETLLKCHWNAAIQRNMKRGTMRHWNDNKKRQQQNRKTPCCSLISAYADYKPKVRNKDETSRISASVHITAWPPYCELCCLGVNAWKTKKSKKLYCNHQQMKLFFQFPSIWVKNASFSKQMFCKKCVWMIFCQKKKNHKKMCSNKDIFSNIFFKLQKGRNNMM